MPGPGRAIGGPSELDPPVAFNSRMFASTSGSPVLPSAHALKACGFLAQSGAAPVVPPGRKMLLLCFRAKNLCTPRTRTHERGR